MAHSGARVKSGGGMGGIIPQMIERESEKREGSNKHLVRAHRAHTLCAMAISHMAMPLLRGLYSLKVLSLATHELSHSLLGSMITNDINFVLEACYREA